MEVLLQYVQSFYHQIFNKYIEERMEIEENMEIEEVPQSSQIVIPQASKIPIRIQSSKIPIVTKRNVGNFNKEAINKENNKILKVKNQLVKSFIKDVEIEKLKDKVINFKSLDELIINFKLNERNCFIFQKEKNFYYVSMGNIVKNIKELHPTTWINILKENDINYTQAYFNFLIQFSILFNKNKKLFESRLSLSFFKKNFNIITRILKDGI